MKRVLITGCSSGMGELLVRQFLASGWETWATLRHLKTRSHLFESLQQEYGDKLKVVELDVTNSADHDNVARLLEQSGGLDCLVNNAGYGLFGATEETTDAQLRAQFETNFFGAANLTRKLLPFLREKRGHIITISSYLGTTGMPLASSYAASKFALEGWFECLAYELRHFGVGVTIIEPGSFRTGFGKNRQWSSSSESPTSLYWQFTKAFKAAHQRLMERPHQQNPEVVTRKIVCLACQKNPPLRVLCGRDAQAGYLVRRLLPSNWFYSIMQATYNKVLNSQRLHDPCK